MSTTLPRDVAPATAQEGEDLARTAAVPNTFRGKYLLERRLPKVVPQIVSKPAPFKSQFYQSTDEKAHEVLSKPYMSSRRNQMESGIHLTAIDSIRNKSGVPLAAINHFDGNESIVDGAESAEAALADNLFFELNRADQASIREERKAQQFAAQKQQLDQYVQDKSNGMSLLSGLAVELSHRRQGITASRLNDLDDDVSALRAQQQSAMSKTFASGAVSMFDTNNSIHGLTEMSHRTGSL